MRRIRWLPLCIAAVIVTAACAPSTQMAPAPKSSSLTCPRGQDAPTFSPSSTSSRNLELVNLKGSRKYVVRDLTDILNVSNVSTLDDKGSGWRFASSSELSYFDDQGIVRMPFGGAPKTAVACAHVWALAWSPDATSAAYVTSTDGAGNSELHIVSGGQNRLVETMTGNPLTDCNGYDCAERISVDLSYSPDGASVSYVQSWGGPVFRLWKADGTQAKSLDGTGKGPGQATFPSMSVWSGTRLYWRDDKGIEVWQNGQQTLLLPGVAWIHPHASPGAALITYMTRDPSTGQPDVYVFDTNTGKITQIAKFRSEPRFLNSHLIWYREERPCVPADTLPCPDAKMIPSGKTDIYDLQDKTEIESLVQAVFDVWPH
ncbi:MAG TPA: hypothetical protein VNA65_09105 [Candidatus Dormibacteraeota bacterium]|nr:hypothetical protein [Candidatus Dormibacteraeota bacterium]